MPSEAGRIAVPILLWGASGHARVVADIVRMVGEYEIIGFLDDVSPERRGQAFCGSRILGGEEQLPLLYQQGVRHIIMAFGDCAARLRLSEVAVNSGLRLARALHPASTLASDVDIGDGTVVMAGAVINAGSVIGRNVIVNTAATIDHECGIAEGVHISPGAHLGGQVNVGRGTWIGIGATIRDKITVGEWAIIGAGAVVVQDIPAGVVAFGVPAKVVRAIP